MKNFPHLFEPIQIGKTTVKNRIFMPPLSTNLADKGYVTDALVEHYSNRARGGVGLIVTGKRLVTDETKKEMKKILDEIQDGTFASKFITEANNGWAHFKAKREMEANHQLEQVGEKIRSMYSWYGENKYAEK